MFREHFSFCFSFFLHGDSNVCASVDVTRHSPIRRITSEHVLLASRSSNPINIMLAPHCLKATLTGVAFKTADDSAISHLLEQWNRYYPLKIPEESEDNLVPQSETGSAPPAVEVLVGDVLMCYPSWMVVIASSEDPLLKQAAGLPNNVLPGSSTAAGQVSKNKGAMLTSSLMDKNAILMVDAGFKNLNIDSISDQTKMSKESLLSKSEFLGAQSNSTYGTCLCCSTRNSRKAISRRERMSALNATLNFHQRNFSVEKKTNATTNQADNRMQNELGAMSPNKSSVTGNITSAITNQAESKLLSVRTNNIDPASFPIMNELLGPPSSDGPATDISKKTSPSGLEKSVERLNNLAETSSSSEDKGRNKVLYTGRFSSVSLNVNVPAECERNTTLPKLSRLKGATTVLDRAFSDLPSGHIAANWLNDLGCELSKQQLYRSEVSGSVYDFDDFHDFTESYSDSVGSSTAKRGRGGGGGKRGTGRGKDPNNQSLKKTAKKRKTAQKVSSLTFSMLVDDPMTSETIFLMVN